MSTLFWAALSVVNLVAYSVRGTDSFLIITWACLILTNLARLEAKMDAR